MRYLVILVILVFGCADSLEQNSEVGHNNCFIIKPVLNPSSQTEPIDFNFLPEIELSNLLVNDDKSKIDSLMEYVLEYSVHKKISIAYECYQNLQYPDSTFLIEIFLNSMENANAIIDKVVFEKTYQKNILNYGSATVYEYSFQDVVEAAPEKMFLIFKDFDNRYKKDYKGFAFCGDGLNWVDVNGTSLIGFIDEIRNTKKYEILLNFDDSRFIPIAHYKIGDW